MSKTKKKYTDEDLIALVKRRKEAAFNAQDDDLSIRRRENLDRYLGEAYGDERAGQSSVVTRQCMEAVEWTLPSLLRVFASSDKICEFIPVGPEDEDAAKQESEYVNHVFTQQNDGFYNLYIWLKDCLINPNSYIKVYWDAEKKTTTEEYNGLLPQEIAQLSLDPELEVFAADPVTVTIETPQGPQEITTYDVQLKRTKKTGRVVVSPIPPEEITVDGGLTTVSLENADFVCHTTHPTRSKLVASGYSKALVKDLPRYTGNTTNGERTGRKEDVAGTSGTADEPVGWENEMVEVNEAYLYLDYDGDGVAEFRMITISGEEVLENEEIYYLPFVSLSSVPMPHSHVGVAWQELVQDLQKIYTTLTRQWLNNLYRTNNPRTIIGRGINVDDVVNDLPNSPIRAKDINAIRLEPTAPIAQNVVPAFEMLESIKEARTGVSRSTMGLDADTLSRVTKGAFLGALEQANQRLELLARIIAEMGVRPLFLKIHQLLLTHQTEKRMAKLSGQWIEVNPAEWRERNDMTVLVGLGTGNKQAQMMALDKVTQLQATMAQMGLRVVDEQKAYNSASKLVEIAGLYNPERYFNDPSKMPPPQPEPPGPDAQMAQIQMEMVKVEQQKAQLKAQSDAMALQQKMMETEKKYQQQIDKLQSDLLVKTEELRLKEKEIDNRNALEMWRTHEDNQTKLEIAGMKVPVTPTDNSYAE